MGSHALLRCLWLEQSGSNAKVNLIPAHDTIIVIVT